MNLLVKQVGEYGIIDNETFFEHNGTTLVGFDDWENYTSLAGPTRPNLIDNLGWQNVRGLLLSYTDSNSQNTKSYFDDLKLGTSSVKGHLTVSNEADKGEFVTFNVTDISNINNSYVELVVQTLNSNIVNGKPFANGANIGFEFTREGEKGQKGAQGYQGYTGFKVYWTSRIYWLSRKYCFLVECL